MGSDKGLKVLDAIQAAYEEVTQPLREAIDNAEADVETYRKFASMQIVALAMLYAARGVVYGHKGG